MGGPLSRTLHSEDLPGPDTYKNSPAPPVKAPLLRSRLPNQHFEYLCKLPGPGAYCHQSMGTDHYYVNSRFSNQTGAAKMTQKSERMQLDTNTQVGPGECTPPINQMISATLT
jgi:hypothetical protein